MAKVLVNSAAIRKKDLIVNDGDLNIVSDALISVIDRSSGRFANIFNPTDNSLPLENPFTSDSTGQFAFYVEPGVYKVMAVTQTDTEELQGEVIIEVSEVPDGDAKYINVDFTVNDSSLSIAQANKALLDAAITEAQTGDKKWIRPSKAGDVHLTGPNYIPDGINIAGIGLNETNYIAYNTGNFNDYDYAFSDGVVVQGLFVFGTSGKSLLPSISECKAGARHVKYSAQIDNLVNRGDLIAIFNTDDYSWGNFRRVNIAGTTDPDYSLTTNLDDRPTYRAGEFFVARTVTSPTATAPTVPNSIFIEGTTYASYTAGANIESYIVETTTNSVSDCTITSIPNQSVAPIFMRQVRGGRIDNTKSLNGKTCIYLLNCAEMQGNGIETSQTEVTQDSEAYGLGYFSCYKMNFNGEFFATRHAVTHGGSFGFTIPSRECVTSGVFKSYRSYACDFHGNTENCKFIGSCDGGVVLGGKNNSVSELKIRPNFDGTAVFVSELPTWNQYIGDINIYADDGQFPNQYGFINIGAGGMRGFAPNVFEEGHFGIGKITIRTKKTVQGKCALPNDGVGVTEAECSAVGGIYDAANNKCVINDLSDYELTDQANCEIIPGAVFGNTYNILGITARNIHKNLSISIQSIDAASTGFVWQAAAFITSQEQDQPYTGTTPINIKNLYIGDLKSVNCGGLYALNLDEIEIENINVNGGRLGIDINESISDGLSINNARINNVTNQALTINNTVKQGEVKANHFESKGCCSGLDGLSSNHKTIYLNGVVEAEFRAGAAVGSATIEPLGNTNTDVIALGSGFRLEDNTGKVNWYDLTYSVAGFVEDVSRATFRLDGNETGNNPVVTGRLLDGNFISNYGITTSASGITVDSKYYSKFTVYAHVRIDNATSVTRVIQTTSSNGAINCPRNMVYFDTTSSAFNNTIAVKSHIAESSERIRFKLSNSSGASQTAFQSETSFYVEAFR